MGRHDRLRNARCSVQGHRILCTRRRNGTTLHFSDVGNPDKLTVKRWPAALLGTQDADAIDEGEEVETALTNGHYTLTAEPGWIYGLNAVWNDRGNAEYGFLCPNR